MKVRSRNILIGLGIIGAIGVLPALVSPSDEPKTDSHKIETAVCTVEQIPFEKQTQEDPNLEIGKTEVRQAGANGQQEICKQGEVETSRKVLAVATTEVVASGTHDAEAERQKNAEYFRQRQINVGQRQGAICNDGTRSSATGRGACSHHGGVDHWLYD